MNELLVTTDRGIYTPGSELSGRVSWAEWPEDDLSLSVRLIWFTEGKGDRDYKTVNAIDFTRNPTKSSVPFSFLLPARPLSFSGQIISLKWAIEVVVHPTKQSTRVDFELATGASEVVLADQSDKLKALGVPKPFVLVGSR